MCCVLGFVYAVLKVLAVGASPVAQAHTLAERGRTQGVNRSSRVLHIYKVLIRLIINSINRINY